MTSVGVLLCTYEGERHVRALLDSLVAQTRPPDVVMVFDDRSSDGTVRAVEAFASTRAPFPVSIHRNRERLGVVGNFSQALAAAATDLVAFADQDDVWEPVKIERLAGVVDDGATAAFSDAAVVDDDLREIGRTVWPSVGFGPRQQRLYTKDPLAVMLKQNPVTGATLVVRRADAQTLLPMSPSGYHDQWLSLLLAADGRRVEAVPEALVRYRFHGTNQVGPPARSRLGRLRRRAASGTSSMDELAFFVDARQRAAALGVTPHVLGRLDAKIAHLRLRRTLPASRARRVPICAIEAARGGYRRYSRGLDSFLLDVVVR